MTDATVYMTHAEYERRDPGAAEHEKQIELARERANPSKFKPRRSFPCSGALVLDGGDPRAKLYICDQCGYQLGIPLGMQGGEATGDWLLERSGIPEHHRKTKLDDPPPIGHADAMEAIEAWSKGAGLPPMLVGEVGRGKTQLLVAGAIHHMNQTSEPVTYWAMADLIKAEQQTFKSGDPSPALEAKKVPVLILDDIGAEKDSPYAVDLLAQIIDARYRAGLPTLGATNIMPADWPAEFGDRTASRLLEICAVTLVSGDDRRIA